MLHQLFIFLHTSKYLAQNYTQDGLIAGQGMNKKMEMDRRAGVCRHFIGWSFSVVFNVGDAQNVGYRVLSFLPHHASAL